MAFYGGRNHRAEEILIKDILTYPGIMANSGSFSCVAASETLTVTNVTLLRTGGLFFNGLALYDKN
jgi:hypothetical protein